MTRALERRQFALLTRNSFRQILSSATLSRTADPMQVAIWGVALALTPPLLVAVRKMIDYPFLLRAPAAYVERVVMADRLFFVIYSMLTSAFLAALLWEALSPTSHDHEVVGSLPVAPRTMAAARLVAAVGLCLAAAVAINAPSGLLYSAASAVHPLVGSFPRVLAAHLVSTVLGALCVFVVLLAVRTVVTTCAGERSAARVAVGLQVLTFVLLVQVFLFLPGILPQLVKAQQSGAGTYDTLPPVWFAALFTWMAEGLPLRTDQPELALMATVAATATALMLALGAASLLRRRDLERRADVAVGRGMRLLVAAAVTGVRRWEVRALYRFAMASLARSRRHAVHLGTFAGLALAVVLLNLASAYLHGTLEWTSPGWPVVSVPLAALFFAVFGLRSCCEIPVDIDANWPFRLNRPSASDALAATRLVLLTAGVVPIVGAAAVLFGWLWGAWHAAWLGLWDAAAGMLLVELALAGWAKVPFATAHEPSIETVQVRWPWFVAALFVYTTPVAVVQVWSLMDGIRAGGFTIAAMVGLAVVARFATRRRRDDDAVLDVAAEGPAVLSLSAASD